MNHPLSRIPLKRRSLVENAFRQSKAKTTALACLLTLSSPNIIAADNDVLKALISGLIFTHNAAVPVSIVPVKGVSDAAELVAFGTNIGLKYVKAPFTSPADVSVMPNSSDQCSYRMTLPQSEAEYQNLMGLWDITPLPTDWGPLGTPTVQHANSDVTVSVDNLGPEPFARTTILQTAVFPAGKHYLQWQAETQISTAFDIVLPLAAYGFMQLKYGKPLLSVGDGSSAQALKQAQFYRKFSETQTDLFLGLGLTGGGLLAGGGVAATHAGPEHVQQFSVFDIFDPLIATEQETIGFEAADFGGTTYERIESRLFDSIEASDPCGRSFSLTNDHPALFPLGDTELTWTVTDLGPNPAFGTNSAILVQTVSISDTQAPLMVPPPGRVIETTLSGLSADDIVFGVPKVVDLADSKPAVSNDVPDFFPVDSRTEVLWQATDSSSNVASSTQWITVKSQGTNTTPVAQPSTVSTQTSAPVDIVLSGIDEDLIDGRVDPLSFRIEQQPDNGEFIAPLYPFFIEDYRTKPEGPFGEGFLTASPRNKWVFENHCQPDNVPWDAVFEPEFMHVTDDGTQYIYDYYWTCNTSSSVGKTNPRISKWDRDGNYLGQTSVNSNTNPQFVLDRDGSIYTTDRVGSGSSTDLFLKRCSTDFGTNSTQCDTSWKFRNGSAPNISPGSLVYARVDSQLGIAFVTDKRRVFAFDIRGGGGDSEYLGALYNGEEFLTSCTAVNSRSGFTIEVDSESNLYIADSCADKIHKFGPSYFSESGGFVAGEHIGWLGRCDGSSNNACDLEKGRSKGYSCTEITCSIFKESGAGQGQFSIPLHLAIDPNDVLYVADYANRRVQRFSQDGSFAGEAVSTGTGVNQGTEPGFILGNFDSPKTVSVNSSQFFIVDQAESFVHVFETSPLKDITDSSATVSYVSNFSFHNAIDTFTYTASDGLAVSEPAQVSVNVARNYRPPEAFAATYSGIEDQDIEITLLADDPDGVIGTGDFNALDVLTYEIVKSPEHGQLLGAGDSLVYRPADDYYGTDEFTFIANDGVLDSPPAIVELELAAINDPPKFELTQEESAAVGFSYNLFANFYDDNLKPELSSQHTVSISWGDGTVSSDGDIDSGNALLISPTIETAPGVITANHIYSSPGSHTVTLCIRDYAGAESCESQSVSVSEQVFLAMEVQPTLEEVSVGDSISYSVEVVNLEPDLVSSGLLAAEVTASYEIPPGLTLTAVSSQEASCTSVDNMASCSLGDMPPGDSIMMRVDAINAGSTVHNDDQDFNVVVMTATESTKEFYLGYALTTILADGTDSDGDGIFDVYETANGLNISVDDSTEDSDGDGLSNIEEFLAGTFANDTDTDDDGISDAWELMFGLNPKLASDALLDSDGDGFANIDEFLADRNPNTSEDSGSRLVPILSVFDNNFLTIPAVQIGSDFFDLDLELSGISPVAFDLIGYKQRAISATVADASTFDLDTLALKVTVAEVLGELYSLEFLLIGDAPVRLQLTAAGAATASP